MQWQRRQDAGDKDEREWAVVTRQESCSANVSSVVSGGESDMGKLLLCATVLTGTAAAGTLVLLAGAAAAGGAAVVCCCRSRQRTHGV
jgi:hypothetical protein